MRIAIVGSGVSGLVAAHILQREHEVTIFEAEARIGGHVHTVDVCVEGEKHAIDTGFIVYNERTYPNFIRLLDELGVETQPTNMSFGVACERTGLEWGSRGLDGIFAQRSNLLRPGYHGMLRDVLRFNREARSLLQSGDAKLALGDYLLGAGYSSRFVEHYLMPMGAAIWSAAPQDFLRMPALTFVRFFDNHGLLARKPEATWRVIRGGSARYVEKLLAVSQARILTANPVFGVQRFGSGVELLSRDGLYEFDEVVLAVHSDQASNMLTDASNDERALLESIRYQENEVILHTDESLMPDRKRAWASWNYRIPEPSSDPASDRALVTYDMNRLQGIESAHRFLVTLNPGGRIDPKKVLGRWIYDHPVFDARAIEAQAHHEHISGRNRTHFCGAWWGHGFHEDGVKSAITVCRKFGLEL